MKFDGKKQTELNNLISWLQDREIRISTYRPESPYDHPIIGKTQIIDNIISAIKHGDLNAIELGCEFIIDNKKIPFGKILKSKILSALKQHVRFVNQRYRQQLSDLTVTLLSLEYHPTEIKFLCRLIKRFEPKYRQFVIHQFTNVNSYTQRWLTYLSDTDKVA